MKVNPAERATVADVLGQVAAVADTRGFSLKEPLNLEGIRLDAASVAQYQQQAQTAQAGVFSTSFFVLLTYLRL